MTKIVTMRRRGENSSLPKKNGTAIIRTCFLTLILMSTLERSMSFVSPEIHSRERLFLSRLCSTPERRTGRTWLEMSRQVQRKCTAALLSICVMVGTMNGPISEASASDQFPAGHRYWSIMSEESKSTTQERIAANEALLDYLVGTINTQFYDNTGGAFFVPRDFYSRWKLFKSVASGEDIGPIKPGTLPPDIHLDTREGAVMGMKWLVESIHDPFSKYLTREELEDELQADSNGFLGTGAVVETPHSFAEQRFSSFFGPQRRVAFNPTETVSSIAMMKKNDHSHKVLTVTRVANLPIVTAVAPDSPAERAGLVVGDRIIGIGDQDFLGWTRAQIEKNLVTKYNQKSYFGQAELTVAKPIYAVESSSSGPSGANENPQRFVSMSSTDSASGARSTLSSGNLPTHEVVLGYRQTKLRLPIPGSYERFFRIPEPSIPDPTLVGGDSVVHYQLLTSKLGSIFDLSRSGDMVNDDYKVGYIRFTRFSKASTAGYVQAVQALEEAGAQSYIFDLRNNYGGVLQEAMLTASTLLRDPHAVLCYTMNARGGFTPHDAEEYIVDQRYPGYLLSSESQTSTVDQVQKENPAMFVSNGIAWDPPSSYASLHEQVTMRGIHRISYIDDLDTLLTGNPKLKAQFNAQKKIVILINEGTASAAEVFVAALHDNARTAAVIGTKSYGKGLIQHTFPMPDGGGLRITVAEYLTPSLSHVTTVGGARYDHTTGEFIGGGIRPDIICESKQGIPGNLRADLCIGVALDTLDEATTTTTTTTTPTTIGDTDKKGVTNTRSTTVGFFDYIPSQILGIHPKSKEE